MQVRTSILAAMVLVLGSGVAVAQAHKKPAAATSSASLATVFREGEEALRAGNLEVAEKNFRRVAAADPKSAGAYANLGVVAMRRRNWDEALKQLARAEKLAPKIWGIRLNIGLAYYRQNRYDAAIAPFESVLHDQPSSGQARYLVGLCYFFTGRYADSAHTLEFLWPEQSSNLAYLYVLGVAAQHAKFLDLEKRALNQLIAIGKDSAQFHLFLGKAHLNRDENMEAVRELSHAAEIDPKLAFVHFNLGVAYLKQQDYERAKAEFLQDIALEPDLSYSYEQLGQLFFQAGSDGDSERYYQEALRRDPNFLSALTGLARVQQRQGKYADALVAIETAEKLAPENSQTQSLKGQILAKLGRRTASEAAFKRYRDLLEKQRAEREQQMSSGMLNNESADRELMGLPELQ